MCMARITAAVWAALISFQDYSYHTCETSFDPYLGQHEYCTAGLDVEQFSIGASKEAMVLLEVRYVRDMFGAVGHIDYGVALNPWVGFAPTTLNPEEIVPVTLSIGGLPRPVAAAQLSGDGDYLQPAPNGGGSVELMALAFVAVPVFRRRASDSGKQRSKARHSTEEAIL